jgi:hypothetical protein
MMIDRKLAATNELVGWNVRCVIPTRDVVIHVLS